MHKHAQDDDTTLTVDCSPREFQWCKRAKRTIEHTRQTEKYFTNVPPFQICCDCDDGRQRNETFVLRCTPRIPQHAWLYRHLCLRYASRKRSVVPARCSRKILDVVPCTNALAHVDWVNRRTRSQYMRKARTY